jgi:type I restriction enzyme, S subunit
VINKSVTLGEVCDRGIALIQTGPFGSQLHSHDYLEFGVPVIPTEAIGHRHIQEINLPRISQEKAQELSRHRLKLGDILFARRGIQATGFSAIVTGNHVNSICSTGAILLRITKKDEIDPEYLSFYLSSEKTILYLKSQAVGAVMPNLNSDVLRRTPLWLPPLEIQKKIASILGALDDKIELNRRMNATLETIAQTLFKSWFVDFDPVKAKAAGLEPEGLDASTAALFPSGFQTSSLGEIPEGWELAELSEICEINPTRKLPRTGLAPYLDMGNMPTKGSRAIDWYDREIGSGAKFINGDTLFARITPCLENGKTAFVDFLENGQVGWGSTEYIVMRPKPPFPLEYAYILARDENFRSHAVQSMTGSSGRQRASAEALGRYSVVIPTAEVLGKYGGILNGFFRIIKSRDEESKMLATTRDSLLPKLLSGELNVNEFELLEATS